MEQSSCNSCHQYVLADSVFCKHCGNTLVNSVSSSVAYGTIISRLKSDLKNQHLKRIKQFQLVDKTKPKQRHFKQFRDIVATDLDVQVDMLDIFNYTLYHCGIGQVHSLRITNNGTEKSQAMTLYITLSEFGDAWEETIPSLDVGEHWEGENLILPLSNKDLREITESTRSTLKIQIKDRYSTLWSKTFAMRILAYNEWVFHSGLLHTLATFIQPNANGLGSIIEKAGIRLKKKIGNSHFSGYQQNNPDHVLAMIDAIHETLTYTIRLAYINPPASFEQTGQKIRLVENTLKERCGTCLDLAVLQASLWERVGLFPQIIIVPGHAMLGCWLTPPSEDEIIPKVIDLSQNSESSAKMWDKLENGDCLLMNSVEITQNKSRDIAVTNAYSIIEKSESVNIIDINACRMDKILPLP